jgi:hypothetical protein
MSDTFRAVTSLSIARHTAQFILRCAIDAGSSQCSGLIGRKESIVINRAAPLPVIGSSQSAVKHFSICDLKHTGQNWLEQAISPCGIFFSTDDGTIPSLEDLKLLENGFIETIPSYEKGPVILMPLLLNTAGCLEIFAYQILNETLLPIPLLLEEDGQQAKNG